jgi:hypothetical protein
MAFIPDFDIPNQFINQDSREFRIYNKTTTDDHGLHVVGYTKVDDHDWYLIRILAAVHAGVNMKAITCTGMILLN